MKTADSGKLGCMRPASKTQCSIAEKPLLLQPRKPLIMSRPSNQAVERHYFEQFRSHCQVPIGEIEYTDKPDVIIRGPRTIGIEIANLYLTEGADPASEQVQRVRRARTLERAQSLYLSTGGKRIELSVDFRPEHPIREVESLAQSLADLAGRIDNLPSGQINPSVYKHVPELRFVYRNAKEYVDAAWRPIQCYSVPALALEGLHGIVRDKAKKAQGYQSCDAYWLLLVVDFMDPAQDQDLQGPVDAEPIKSPFERVLLYKPQFAQVVQVSP